MFTESLVPTTSLRSHSSVSISNSILHLKQYRSDMRACLAKPEGKKNEFVISLYGNLHSELTQPYRYNELIQQFHHH